MKIAEVTSRIPNKKSFIRKVESIGFKLLEEKVFYSYFKIFKSFENLK